MMGTVSVLKVASVESALPVKDRVAPVQPVSLLAFLRAENHKLQTVVTQLERETTALRHALQHD
jgi:hypothetical protein